MTTFILHGGFPKVAAKFDDRMFEALQKDVPNGGTVLMVFFAKPPDVHERLFTEHLPHLKRTAGRKTLHYVLATAGTFIEQVRTANAMYLAGGETWRLMEFLKQFPNFRDAIQGKIILGSSAGANVLCRFSYSDSADEVGENLGIIPVVMLPHDKGDQKAYDALRERAPDAELVTLKEFEMRKITLDY